MGHPQPVNGSEWLTRLEWESEHFGFAVAKLGDPCLEGTSLRDALAAACALGFEMVVWSVSPAREVSEPLLREFQGALVDAKTTFVQPLGDGMPGMQPPTVGVARISAYGGKTASDDLLWLALAAGGQSRFRVDPRFPREHFEQLYRIWIERSVRHEMADEVLLAEAAEGGRTVGMITLASSDGVGSIGLIAVDRAVRGLGIGSQLVLAGLSWMHSRDVHEARVVTQGTNVPACRLYERSGFQIGKVEHIYHFWPQKGHRHQQAA